MHVVKTMCKYVNEYTMQYTFQHLEPISYQPVIGDSFLTFLVENKCYITPKLVRSGRIESFSSYEVYKGIHGLDVLVKLYHRADNRCIWKLNNNNGNFIYTTDCKTTAFAYNFMQTYKFCPYCGKPILVEDTLLK